MGTVVTRIAPSPTGWLHFGLARTALFSYLYAKKHGGSYILRIEDTDAARNRPEYEADIYEQFKWLGLDADATYRQSEHIPRHRELLEKLVAEDKAYLSKEPSKADPSIEVEVVRLRNSGEAVSFTDMIRGEITVNTTDLGDFVIARGLDQPLYHLAVVIDDRDEGVTHVIRGEDHITNTARHILIQRALQFDTPEYAHLPLILMPDKSKMSKRREGSSVKYYRERGILPQALINYIALLGWNPGTEQEIFTLSELIEQFDISLINKSGAVFDSTKLNWYNKTYLAELSDAEFSEYIGADLAAGLSSRGIAGDASMTAKLIPVIRERISSLVELREMIGAGELDCFFSAPALDAKDIPQKGTDAATAARHLQKVHELFSGLSDEMFAQPERLKDSVWEYATIEGRGAVLWPTRFSLSGRARSPDPFEIASIIGKKETLSRLENARTLLNV